MTRFLLAFSCLAGMLPRLCAQQMETGWADYYADYLHGQVTALGEVYDRHELTCAHKHHPKGALLKVTNAETGQSVVVRVNDRGPYQEGFVARLSLAAANAIGLTLRGKAKVGVEPVGHSSANPANPNRPARAPLVAANNTFSGDQFTARGAPANDGFDPSQIRRIAPGQAGYVIQIGAYGNYDNAANQIVSIQKMGVRSLYLLESTTAQGIIHRVVLGVFDQRAFAESFRERLQVEYQLNGVVLKL
jgi:rare lipoprotein A